MSGILCVQWTLFSPRFPEPIVHCSGCGVSKPYRSSGKFRLNARGKRLDAWLIYRCPDCGNRWNRPLFKQRKVSDIPPALLQALQANDACLLEGIAFDTAPFAPKAAASLSGTESRVQKQILTKPREPWTKVEIRIAVAQATPLRLDRLLAAELKLTRARIQELAETKRLYTNHAIRRPVRDATQLSIELAALDDGVAVGMAAAGLAEDWY